MLDSASEGIETYALNNLRGRGVSIVEFLGRDLVNPLYEYDMDHIYTILSRALKQKDISYVYLFDPQWRSCADGNRIVKRLTENVDDFVGETSVTVT